MPVIVPPSGRPRGSCIVCGYSMRLRKDGTVQTHHLWSGRDRYPDPCKGSGHHPRRGPRFHRGYPLCMDCSNYLQKLGPMLIEAAASVGIETGTSIADGVRLVIIEYHERGHKELE